MIGIIFSVTFIALLIIVRAQTSNITRHGRKLPYDLIIPFNTKALTLPRKPPGTLPLAGYGPWFLQPRYKLLDWFAEIAPSMGYETYEIPVPSLPPAVLINHPKNLEYVLKNVNLFVKGHFFRSRSWDLFANGILNADGALWRIQRKAGLRFLSNTNLKVYLDEVVPSLVKDMALRLDHAAEQGQVVDLQDELLRLTTRFTGHISYGVDIDPTMPFSKAFDYASGVTNARFTNPFWRVSSFFFGWRFRRAVKEVHTFGSSIVAEAKEKGGGRSEKSDDVMQNNLIQSLLGNISDEKLVAESATNYLSAGRDTTAQSMTWAMYSLMGNPEKEQKLVESVREQFPDLPRGQTLPMTYDDIAAPNAFMYANAVFAETLRLNPAIPLEIKETTELCELPDGTRLPKGAAVVWLPYAMARCPLTWGEDAASFVPERWIQKDAGGNETFLQKTAFENPVFNAGPRMCIGKRLAELLAVRIVPELCWRWKLTYAGSGRRVLAESLTAPMKGGLPVKVEKVA